VRILLRLETFGPKPLAPALDNVLCFRGLHDGGFRMRQDPNGIICD